MSSAALEKLLAYVFQYQIPATEQYCIGYTATPDYTATYQCTNTTTTLVSFINSGILWNLKDSISGVVMGSPDYVAGAMFRIGAPTVTVDGTNLSVSFGFSNVTTTDLENE